MVAGNLVATMSTGDIVQAGLGTITSVCGDRVVGFGHPMNFVGKTTYLRLPLLVGVPHLR